jgi:hypothetical protein
LAELADYNLYMLARDLQLMIELLCVRFVGYL